MTKRIAAGLVVFVLVGCGGGAAKQLIPHASCNIPSAGACQEASGLVGSALTDFQAACTAVAGTNSSAECAVANLMGNCTFATGVAGVDAITRYYTPAWDAFAAEVDCTSGTGTYTDLLPHASCDRPGEGVCQESSGLSGTDLVLFQSSCTSNPGTNSTAACTAASRVGTCVYPDPSPGISNVLRFYSPTWSATSAETECTSGGGVVGSFWPG